MHSHAGNPLNLRCVSSLRGVALVIILCMIIDFVQQSCKSNLRSPPPPHPPAVSVKTTLDASKHSCVSCGCNSSTSTPLCKESRKAANFSLQDSVLGFKNNPICAVYVSLFFFQSFCTCSIIFRLCKAPSPVPASSTPVPVSYTRVPASSTQVPSEFHPSSRQFHPSSSQFHPN